MPETLDPSLAKEKLLEVEADYQEARAAAQVASQRRTEAVRAANEAGLGLRPIGEAIGVHFTRVRQIIKGK